MQVYSLTSQVRQQNHLRDVVFWDQSALAGDRVRGAAKRHSTELPRVFLSPRTHVFGYIGDGGGLRHRRL